MIYFQSTWKKRRTQNMYVSTPDGRIEYVAASLFELEAEMEKVLYRFDATTQNRNVYRRSFFLCLHDSFGFCQNTSLE